MAGAGGRVCVTEIAEGTPAAASSLQAGDWILSVNDEDVSLSQYGCSVAIGRARAAGALVRLQVRRAPREGGARGIPGSSEEEATPMEEVIVTPHADRSRPLGIGVGMKVPPVEIG